jgi:hypothetical protein
VVRAYDPTGVLAGRATVALSGWYLMPVYGDDPMTALDEGAVSGDRITFTVDGCPAVPLGPDPPIWAEAGRRVEVELAATCAPVDTVHLRPGSNLISLPRIPADSRLEAVLRGIAGKWRRVWAWDACAGKWKHAAADAPSWANTWQSIDYRYGFWIDVIEDTTLQVSGGFAPSGSEIPLCEGWNLVGAPLQAVVNVEAAWAGVPWDAAWTYRDGAWQPITPGGGGVWEPSRGYWIHVTTVAPPPLRVP